MISCWHYSRLHKNGLHKPQTNHYLHQKHVCFSTGLEGTCTWGFVVERNSSFWVNSSESLQTSGFIYRRADPKCPIRSSQRNTSTADSQFKPLKHCWETHRQKLEKHQCFQTDTQQRSEKQEPALVSRAERLAGNQHDSLISARFQPETLRNCLHRTSSFSGKQICLCTICG